MACACVAARPAAGTPHDATRLQSARIALATTDTNGHDVIPCVFEVFGGAAPEVLSQLEGWGRAARSKTPPGVEPPWSARNFMPFWSQLLSMQAQRGAAIEILNRVDGEAADREAARLRAASG